MRLDDFPELLGVCAPFSAEWYRRARDIWLERYPEADQVTRDNLDMFVRMAEQREAAEVKS